MNTAQHDSDERQMHCEAAIPSCQGADDRWAQGVAATSAEAPIVLRRAIGERPLAQNKNCHPRSAVELSKRPIVTRAGEHTE